MSKNLSLDQNGIIFYAKRNSMCTMAFVMPTNVGPTYGMYVGPTLHQLYMSNMSYVCATLCQHVGPTMAQRASLRWANVVCQRWANGVANQNTPLAQRYLAIWVDMTVSYLFLFLNISIIIADINIVQTTLCSEISTVYFVLFFKIFAKKKMSPFARQPTLRILNR